MSGFDTTDPAPSGPGGDRSPYDATRAGQLLAEVANHWGLVVAYGVASAGLGVVLAVWPGETLVVCAVLVAIQLIVSGVMRLSVAIAGHGLDRGLRAVIGLSGAVGLIIGLLCLRHPVQTLVAISLLLGVWSVLAGIIDILAALLAPTPGRRGWDLLAGAISIVAGGFLLIDPRLTLGALVVVVCTWLIAIGLVAIVAGLRLRTVARQSPPRSGPEAGPATGLHAVG